MGKQTTLERLKNEINKKWNFEETKIEQVSMENRTILITDSSKNGCGVVIKVSDIFVKLYYGKKDLEVLNENNPIRNEIRGLITGLNWCISLNKKKLLVYSDNDTVVSCLRGKTTHESKELEILVNIISKNKLSILVEKVENKDKNKYLELCDSLSRKEGEEKINQKILELCEKIKETGSKKIEVKKLDEQFLNDLKKKGKERSEWESSKEKRVSPQKNGKSWSEVVSKTLPIKEDVISDVLIKKIIELINLNRNK